MQFNDCWPFTRFQSILTVPAVVIAVRITYQSKVFPNAGSMAKSKGKVDKGTGPAELIVYS